MAETPPRPATGARWDRGHAELEAWLQPYGATALGPTELRAYAARRARAGWRVSVSFDSGPRRIDIVLDDLFPFSPPRLALVDRPAHLTWPHIESDGVLCLLNEGDMVDAHRPVDVLQRLLAEATEWLEASEAGTNVEDFRTEFLSYWEADEGAPRALSLLEPRSPSRMVRMFRGRTLRLVGEDDSVLQAWLEHAWGPPEGGRDREMVPAVLVWLEQPMVPSEFPTTAADLLRRIREVGLSAEVEALDPSELERLVVVLGAESGHGPALCAVALTAAARGGRSVASVERGFRPGRAPQALVSGRVAAQSRLRRSAVERVDAAWIHGRGTNPDLPRLRGVRVALVGCGALGGPVSLALAQAGIGQLDLIDPDIVAAANIGRQVWGAADLGVNKAVRLATRIRETYPHIHRAEGHAMRWETLAAAGDEALAAADLIISTTADASAEHALDAWRRDRAAQPDLLFGWTEPHSVAGHAVGLTQGGGCFGCGWVGGSGPVEVAAWPCGTGRRAEPACGVMYQPYGPVEAAHVSAAIAEAALDILLDRTPVAFHRVWVARQEVLTRAGGVWSDTWTAAQRGAPSGGRLVEQPWPTRADCPRCGGGR